MHRMLLWWLLSATSAERDLDARHRLHCCCWAPNMVQTRAFCSSRKGPANVWGQRKGLLGSQGRLALFTRRDGARKTWVVSGLALWGARENSVTASTRNERAPPAAIGCRLD